MNAVELAMTNARTSARSENYSESLAYLESIGDQPYLSAEYFLLKGRLIQSGDGIKYSLEDSRQALERALELSPENPEILSELGFLYLRVVPDNHKAQDFFQRAMQRFRLLYSEAICGLAEAKLGNALEARKIIEEELAALNKTINDTL
jgi:tetratricopeptide (TPR) repeat protein